MLETEDSLLVLVDVQVKLARVIHERDDVIENAGKLVRGALALGLPIIWTEQNPGGIGRTVPALAELLPGKPITKLAFSCCGEPPFVEAVRRSGRKQILLAGIETHICVYQTAVDLLAAGYEVHVASDAVGSRSPRNKAVGLGKIKDAGAAITSVETALFELLKVAEGEKFKAILKIVK